MCVDGSCLAGEAEAALGYYVALDFVCAAADGEAAGEPGVGGEESVHWRVAAAARGDYRLFSG